MNLIPSNAQKIEIEDASVDFYKLELDGKIYFYFDSSGTAVPEPMINAMIGLKLIDSNNKFLVMINHSLPTPLFQKVDQSFDFDFEEFSSSLYKITFSCKEDSPLDIDFTQRSCKG